MNESLSEYIKRASDKGLHEVEEMQKHPLSEEEVERAISMAQETLRISRELILITDRDTDTVYLSPCLPKDYPEEYAAIIAALDRHKVRHDLLPGHFTDCWCREYMPVQSRLSSFVGYTFFPDGFNGGFSNERSRGCVNHDLVSHALGIETELLPLILCGDDIVKCRETVILTEKVFAQNSNYTPEQITAMLEKAFQAEVFYLPWDHTERFGYAGNLVRHIRLNRVLFTNYHDFNPVIADEMLHRLRSRFLRVIELRYDVPKPHPLSWVYINYLQTSRVILLPALGIPEDEQALEQIRRLFPDYSGRIEQIPIASLVCKDGALNSLCWNIRTEPFEF